MTIIFHNNALINYYNINLQLVPSAIKPRPHKHEKTNDYDFFQKKPKIVNLSWGEIKSGFENLYVCKSDKLVKKKDINSALRMISKLKLDKSFPVDELKNWEKIFGKWLKEIDGKKLKVIEI